MDAYDIFKKLTKGLNVSKPKRASQKTTNEDVKVETITDNESPKTPIVNQIKLEQEESENIVLLSTLNTEKKGKKRKSETEEEVARKKKLLETEKVNHYRNLNHISVVGKKVPEPAHTFQDFQIDEDIIENLRKCGYEEPTPIQKQAVPIMLRKKQLLASAPTGSGKTAAFLVPVIQQLKSCKKEGFRAIILCPTRELAKQTQRECLKLSDGRNFKIPIVSKLKKSLDQHGGKICDNYDMLITTPKRICFLLNQETNAIKLENVEWVIIDEADKFFEENNRGFKQQLDQILTACTNKNRKIAMFSATCTPVVSKWCVRHIKPLVRVTVGHRNAATTTVDQTLQFVGNEQGKLMAFRDIVRNGMLPPVLIFVQSKERAQQLFNELIYDGINVDAIHADRTQLQRDNTVHAFREGKIWVLICTELMARGVDFKGVNLVINYDFPPSSISYVHRIGRAGRAGRTGKAITFFTTDDVPNLRSIAHVLKESGCEVPDYMLSMKKLGKKERLKRLISAPKKGDISVFPKFKKKRSSKKLDKK